MRIEDFGDNYLACDLYLWLCLKAAKQDGFFTDSRNRTVAIKKGEVVFGKAQWAKYLRTPETSIWRALKQLEDVYKKVKRSPSENFTVVSINNINDIFNLERSWNAGETLTETLVEVQNAPSVKRSLEPYIYTSNILTSNCNPSTGPMRPMTRDEIYEFSVKYNWPFPFVRDTYKQIMEQVEAGSTAKYPVKNIRLTLVTWCKNAIRRGDESEMDEMQRQINQMSYSPEALEQERLMELAIIEENKRHE